MQTLNIFMIKEDLIHWLKEDMPFGDLSTSCLNLADRQTTSYLIAKETGVLCGTDVFCAVYELINPNIHIDFHFHDGDSLIPNQCIATLNGAAADILMGERLSLNLLQHLSGIASVASLYAQEVLDLPTRIVDTRKTTPGLRLLEKYAVRVGGCHNHRYSLSDAVMLKDNHIAAAGGITSAIKSVRESIPHTSKIEVEVESISELVEAIEAGADIVMLDNMSLEAMKEAIAINNKRVILEASGNMTLERIRAIAELGVDIISVGALTHSVKALDISLKYKKEVLVN